MPAEHGAVSDIEGAAKRLADRRAGGGDDDGVGHQWLLEVVASWHGSLVIVHHAPFAASEPKWPFSRASRSSNAAGSCRASPLSRASALSLSGMRTRPTPSA